MTTDPTTTNIDAPPEDVVPLTVGDLRRAMDGLPDTAQAFIDGSALSCHLTGKGDRKIVGAIQSQQIPWSNPDWEQGDQLVPGLELWAEWYDDAQGKRVSTPAGLLERLTELANEWSSCWCGNEPRRDCPRHGSDDCRHMAKGTAVLLQSLAAFARGGAQ